jgi:hypothetical protein
MSGKLPSSFSKQLTVHNSHPMKSDNPAGWNDEAVGEDPPRSSRLPSYISLLTSFILRSRVVHS